MKEELGEVQPAKGRGGGRVPAVKAERRAGPQGEGRSDSAQIGAGLGAEPPARRADVRAGCDAGGGPELRRLWFVAELRLGRRPELLAQRRRLRGGGASGEAPSPGRRGRAGAGESCIRSC